MGGFVNKNDYALWLSINIKKEKRKKHFNSLPNLDYLLTNFKNKISSINELETWEYLFRVWLAHHTDCVHPFVCMCVQEKSLEKRHTYGCCSRTERYIYVKEGIRRFQRSLWKWGSEDRHHGVCKHIVEAAESFHLWLFWGPRSVRKSPSAHPWLCDSHLGFLLCGQGQRTDYPQCQKFSWAQVRTCLNLGYSLFWSSAFQVSSFSFRTLGLNSLRFLWSPLRVPSLLTES